MTDEPKRAALVKIDEDFEPIYLECTSCQAGYDPDTPGIRDWCYCPSCGALLDYVDEVDYGARIDGQEQLAQMMRERPRPLSDGEALALREFRIGGMR